MKGFVKRIVTIFLAALLVMSVIVPVSASAEYRLGYKVSYSGKYVTLTIEPKDSADTIYYTVNGKSPTQKSKVYSAPIKASTKAVIRAVEYDKNGKRVGSLKVTIKPRLSKPVISLYTEDGKKYVKMTCAEKGAKIYYTTDGSEPTNKSALYKDKVPYTEGTEIKAIAYKSGMTKSSVATFSTIVSTVTFTVAAEVGEVFELTNKERAANGSSELVLDPELCAAAQIRVEELATLYDHTRPDGSRGIDVIEELGISCTGRGENIARKQTTPAEVVANWMASPSHRKTLLSVDFDRIGIGHYYSGGVHYWVQLFIRK